MDFTSLIFILSAIITGCSAYEYCSLFKYCGDGEYCCNYNTECCSTIYLSIGAIVGIAIGSIIFIGFIVAAIFCFVKHKARTGHVIQPQPHGGNVTVISAGQYQQQYPMQPYGLPSYGQPSYAPYPYGQPSHGQQPYGQAPPFQPPAYSAQSSKPGSNQPGQDVAYPPPPPAY